MNFFAGHGGGVGREWEEGGKSIQQQQVVEHIKKVETKKKLIKRVAVTVFPYLCVKKHYCKTDKLSLVTGF